MSALRWVAVGLAAIAIVDPSVAWPRRERPGLRLLAGANDADRRQLAGRLRDAGVESPRAEARLLLTHAMGVSREDLISGRVAPDRAALSRFEASVERRCAREPFAYIVGRNWPASARPSSSLSTDRNAAKVLPVPVGAMISTSAPAAIRGQAAACGGVGRG